MNAHTKKFLGGALLMVIVASCVGAAKAPTPEEEARNQRLLFVSNVQMALEASLKDPGSVQYIRKAIHLKQGVVCIKYRAKNSFGGYAIGHLTVEPSGDVSQTEKSYRHVCNGKDSDYELY